MPKNATINARIDENLKAKAEKVLRRVGVGHTDLITMLYHQVVEQGGIPFAVRIPNKDTREAIAETRRGGGKRHRGATKAILQEIIKSGD
jgi:DNA-damage-inducible protein J